MAGLEGTRYFPKINVGFERGVMAGVEVLARGCGRCRLRSSVGKVKGVRLC